MTREQREKYLESLLPEHQRDQDYAAFSDTELEGLISLAGRKAAHREERGDRPPKRRRKR